MKRTQLNMLQGPLLPNIIRYSVPIVLTGVLQLLFNAADLVVVGQFCGSSSLAAVSATGALTHLIVGMFLGLSVGAGVNVAHAIGSRDQEGLHRTIHTAIPVAIICGVILAIIGIFFSYPVLQMMGTPKEILPYSTIYMQIYFGGIVFSMVYNFGAAILRALGDTKGPLISLTIAGGLNVVLNVIFVTVFHLNVAGVALATALSQGVSMVLVVRILMLRSDGSKFELKKMRIYSVPLRKILVVGLPAGVQASLFNLSNVVIQSSVNSFGDIFMSGCAASSNLEGFVITAMNGFHQAALNFTGQNVGAGQYKRVKKVLLVCLGCVSALGMAMGWTMYAFAKELLSIYISDSQQAIEYGILRMAFVCVPYFIWGLMDVTTGVLRGLGSSLLPMVVSVFGICVFRIVWISTIFQIPQYHTPESLFVSYPISWGITLIVQLIGFVIVYRRCVKSRGV